MSTNIAIVGAGVGGLAAAARLASRGYSVHVFEKLPECGGRNHLLNDRGFKFDMGPSFVLMPDFFEEIFSYCNEDIKDYLRLQAIDPSYTIFFPDSGSLTVFKDSSETKKQLEKIEAKSSKAFDNFIKKTASIYNDVRPFLYTCFTKKDIFNPAYWGLIKKINPLESYWQFAKRFFKTEKLCYAFTFEAMFMGVSPFNAPSFYSIISYADHVQKIFHPMGSMYEIPLALEKLAKKYGAKFYYNTPVKKISEKDRKIVLEFKHCKETFDKAVVNADYAYTQSELLGRGLPKFNYSCSVFLIYLGLKKKVRGFSHHNLFFSNDLRRNLNQIFFDRAVPDDPSFYVHVPTVTDASLAPEGKEIFYILIPVSNLENMDEDNFKKHEHKLRKFVFRKISEKLEEKLEDLIEVEHRFYPGDFIERYNIKYGATFGLSHNLFQSAFFRPSNFDAKIKNLYFAGASTQPGGGLPVVIAGSRIVSDLITA